MAQAINRREFLKVNTAASLGLALTGTGMNRADSTQQEKPVRVGVIGTGGRGSSLLKNLLKINNVQVPALCDINPARLTKAQQIVEKAGRNKPEGYEKGPEDFKSLLDRDDLDAVIIATPWEWHTPMAVYAMKAGKAVGVEVPAALTLEECWELIDTHESTGTACMMLENWSFRRDNLAVLNMIRQGLFGEIVHCHCAHSHNCVNWYLGKVWPSKHLIKKNADQYPTHSLGPVLSWMDINCGDRFDYVTSMASRSLGLNDQLARKHGPDHPHAKQKYAQGDIVTTMVKTVKGNTIMIANDMQLPRPYDNRWLIQGTRGLYNEQRNSVCIDEGKPDFKEKWEPFDPFQEKYEHQWWRAMKDQSGKFGHGGTDYLELKLFTDAVRNKSPLPLDIYDSVIMSVIVPLSQQSIAQGSAPVKCPDFTRGKWKTKKSYFALET